VPLGYSGVADPHHFLRIWIHLFTLMRIRIRFFSLMLIRIRLFSLMRMRIRLFPLMRTRIRLFSLMRIRIRLFSLMRIPRSPDPVPHQVMRICDYWSKDLPQLHSEPPRLHSERPCFRLSLNSSWIFSLYRMQIRLLSLICIGTGFSLWCGSWSDFPQWCAFSALVYSCTPL
jgi:hypothetical protein